MIILPSTVVAPGTPGVDTILTSTNVLENDATVWSAGTINLGQQRMYNHRLYQVIANPSTTDQPDVGAAKAVSPTWLDLGAVNRWKMFDALIASQTTRSGNIAVTITPGAWITGLALFGLEGTSLTITMTDPIEGVVYNRTVSLIDNSMVVDWWTYFTEPIVQLSTVVLLDLPAYMNAVLSITVDAGAGTAKIGDLVIGSPRVIGEALFGTGIGIDSYSLKTRDDFGNLTIIPRAYSDRVDFDVIIPTPQVYRAKRLLTDLRDTPCVYIGDSNRLETIVYGFFKTFNIVLEDNGDSSCSIEVEGLT
ncbi:hypothetical protein [Rhizorhabdus sp.]|uniref:hypothetical protein n=1 Tax=Rhizorhabdus sp. TaxID=1968843 RepID=UPI0019C168A7|nr:hypothetical protein [Rhizorhabdus sp.]MBD3762472.1 hypothetical protein [Rhizorhabdus sp.]